VELQLTDELVLTGIYLGVMAIGLVWVVLRAIRYARHIRAQNAAEALWIQTFAVQGRDVMVEQPATADNPEQDCTPSGEDETPDPKPEGAPQAE
jgi:hypothetical protein